MTDPDGISPDDFAGIVDRSAGGPQYRELIDKMQTAIDRLTVMLIILVAFVIAASLGYVAERRTSTRIDANVAGSAAVSSAANTLEVLEHRIANESAHACQVDYLRAVAEAFARRDAEAVLRVPPCPEEDIPTLERERDEAYVVLRSLDPDHPYLSQP